MVAAAILRNGYDVIFPQWVHLIWTKFGSMMQNNMQITANWSRSKSEVEFQYGGRLYFETGSSYIEGSREVAADGAAPGPEGGGPGPAAPAP